MPSTSGSGRRAAQSAASPMDNDQEERDKCLTKVQARDLVEFGMIPVSKEFRARINHETNQGCNF